MKQYLKPEDIKMSLANTPQITFEVTDMCNLNCTYCGYGSIYYDHDARENKMLPENKAFMLLDYLRELWHSSLNTSYNSNVYISFYGGEPLVNMDFIKKTVEYIENHIKNEFRTFSYSMTTNAILLDKYIDYLVEHKFHLLISLDGDEENTGYRVDKNGQPAFNRIVKNVDYVKEKYPEYFNERVNFNAVLHNKNSVESIYRFFKDKYGKTPSIGDLNNIGIRPEKISEFEKMYRNSTENLFKSEHYSDLEKNMFMSAPTYQSAALFLRQYSDFVYRNYNELLYGKPELKNLIPTGSCIPFSKKIFITVNGKILPCERIGQQFALGQITDDEIILDFEKIADKYNNYYAKLEKQCAACKNRRACIQCVYNLPDIENKTVKCHGYMIQKEFESYRNAQMSFLYRNPEAYSKIMKEVVMQ